MNKLVIRVILIIIVLGSVLLIIFRTRSPFGKNNSSFASEPEEEITGIELSRGEKKLYLHLEGDKWLLNNKVETRKSAVIFLITVLQEMKIKSTVSEDLFDKEIVVKSIEPVRVKVFEKKRLLKSFIVYKTRSNPYGNIMRIKDRSKPFIVYLPGRDSDIGSVFTLNELYWQPYNAFNLLPSQIVYMQFENFSDNSSTFSISNDNHQLSFSDINGRISGWDSVLVMRYLSYFTWIPFESWALDLTADEKRKIESQQPLYRISVKTDEDKMIVLTLWERMKGTGEGKLTDSDRLLGKIDNNKEFFIMRYFDIDPILKKKSYFFPH